MKTIDIQAKEWFDRINGNSYFSMQITIDFGLKTEQTIYVPMQYGYGNQFEYEAKYELIKNGLLKQDFENLAWWQIKEKTGIILRTSIATNCLKRDVVAYGTE